MPAYCARVLAPIDNGPGICNSLRVGVFRGDAQIGEYVRNYRSLYNTFVPFRSGDRDLALYSPDYTATRLMDLPSCKDVGGEEPASFGFCPVDFHVPSYVDYESELKGRAFTYRVHDPTEARLSEQGRARPAGPRTYYPFGFVAGCVWGDDTSWKIQFLDLSQAAQGVIKRDDRFGYIELPEGVTLAQAVNMEWFEDDDPVVRLAVVRSFNVRTGKPPEM